jgi:hypothetical protein
MPVRPGVDKVGPYYQWGSAKRYYYLRGSPRSKQMAQRKAERQGAAIERREGGGRIVVPPSLREALGAEISRDRLRTLDAWFRRRPETEHDRRGGPAVKRWVARTAAALPNY